MKIGVIGLGFVGNAVNDYFDNTDGVELVGYDKFKNGGIGHLENVLDSILCYFCLPTLFDTNIDTYDTSAIHENLELLQKNNYKGIIIIKSTVVPGTCKDLQAKYNLKIIHNPEFLTARTAVTDFSEQKHIVIGTTDSINYSDIQFIQDFHKKYFPSAHITNLTSTESESMKIMANSFYAVKVQLFNEYYLLCQKYNANYDKIVDAIIKNGWLNPMHTKVPGPDGLFSYGGACFPKDTKALLGLMKKLNIPNKVLAGAVKEQSEFRN